MGEIVVVAEHRQGEIRDVTYEMLYKADQLCWALSHRLTAVVLAGKDEGLSRGLARMADRVLVLEDKGLEHFDADFYKEILDALIKENRPFLTLVGHTSWGINLAPALAVKTQYPLATDCVDLLLEDSSLKAVRQIYSGKIFSKVGFMPCEGYLVTVRPGAFPVPEGVEDRHGEVLHQDVPAGLSLGRKEFVELVDTGAGEIDISQAELLVSIGRGVGEEENIEIIKDLAQAMGGTLSCSRPIVDKNWLPKYHQVGTSGKSVKPKVYLAFGISGAFQHVAGITGAGTVIAVNKDKGAPIFRVADYGVIDDLFKIIDALKERLEP